MADSDKIITITPNTSVATTHPEIKFVGKDNSPMYLRVLDDNSLSFEGAEGQVFSMSPTMSSGDIFSVSDISGIQNIAVNADGTITMNAQTQSTTIKNNASNTATLILENTNADAIDGPILDLYRNDSANSGDGDDIGAIVWSANNDAGEKTNFGRIMMEPNDVSNGSEDGEMIFKLMEGGSDEQEYFRLRGGVRQFEINAGTDDIDFCYNSDATSNFFFINANTERIGIGDAGSAPSHLVHIEATGANGEVFVERTSGAGILLQAQSATGKIGTSTNHDLAFMTNGSTRLHIETDGKVGIGTTSPGEKLHVGAGNINLDAGYYYNFRDRGDLGMKELNYSISIMAPEEVYVQIDSNSNNNNDTFFAIQRDGNAVGGGTEIFKVMETGAVTFNQAYTFPTSDGSANQVLQTDGSGTLSFADVSGGGGLSGGESVTYTHNTTPVLTLEQNSANGSAVILSLKGVSNEILNVKNNGSLFFNLSTAGGSSAEAMLTYRDTAGAERNFLVAAAGTISLQNRGPNGDVDIRANNATAGGSGESIKAQFKHDQVIIKSKVYGDIVTVSSNTTLTQAQSGARVIWSGGTLTLPADPTVGTHYQVWNVLGLAAQIALGAGDSFLSSLDSGTNPTLQNDSTLEYIYIGSNNWVWSR
tara:strand:- start:4802 stop:6742 length:1941 start_codon:yes stop_codon:yes gene_type:complete